MVHSRLLRPATAMVSMMTMGALTLATTAATAATTAAASAATNGPAGIVPGINALRSAACPTAKTCVSVGTDSSLNGKSAVITVSTGKAKPWPGTLTNEPPNAVACAAKAATCLTVADDAVATVAVATGAMTVTAVPKAPPGGIVALGAIACASAKACYAVGFQGSRPTTQAIVVRLSAAGKVVKKTVDTGTGSGAIACPASSRCLLSDFVSPTTSIQVLANGKIGASSPMPANTYVQAISCYHAKLCYALGGNGSANPAVTDELFPLNPTTGAPGSVITLPGINGTGLACASATRCVVAGFTGSGSTAKPATVVVNGGTAAKPVNHPGVNLSGIGCASATVCYAVGLAGTGAIVDKVSA